MSRIGHHACALLAGLLSMSLAIGCDDGDDEAAEPAPATSEQVVRRSASNMTEAQIDRFKRAFDTYIHEKGYDEMHTDWQASTDALVSELERALAEAGDDAAPVALEHARAALSAVRLDGSRGVHNYELTRAMIEEALERGHEDR